MTLFTIEIESDLDAPQAWERVLDLRAHSEVVPLTTLTGDALQASDLTPGTRFVARTSLGPVKVDDAMVVDEITPPHGDEAGVARIRKEGKVLRGWVELTVTPLPGGGSFVRWVQDISVRGVPGGGSAAAKVAQPAYARTLRRLLARR